MATLVLWGSGSSALAAPKTIAVVNLSGHPEASTAAQKVRDLLDKTADLRPTTPGDLARALEDALPEGGADAPVLAEASAALAAGESAFTEFKSRQARSDLDKARRLLFTLAPSERTSGLLADVSFQMALLHLREQNHGLAMGELQLLHRLEERESIDPARYPPDVVRAFKQASRAASGGNSATISISATYDGAPVFLDGEPAGASPLTLQVSAGTHIVAIAAPQYQAAATMIDIDPGATQSHRIDLEPRDSVTRALELRFDAKDKGLDADALREAAARVSRLVGSDSVMLIVDGENSGPSATLYIQHLDRLSYRQAVDDELANMLGLVLEVPRPTLLDGFRESGPVPWYKKTWGIAAIGGGTALTSVALILLGTSDNSKPPRTGEAGFEFPEP